MTDNVIKINPDFWETFDSTVKQAADGSIFPIFKMSDMQNLPAASWLMHNLLFKGQVSDLYAPPGSFKSFIGLDLASRLVHGLQWDGRILKPGRVIYVAGEGFAMFYRRRLAWFKHNNIEPHDDGLAVINRPVNLTDNDETTIFIDEMKQNFPGVDLVVFDTLSTMIAGQNENDSAVMTGAIENAKRVGRELNCHVMVIHHPGKDASKGARGHSSLRGNVDTEITVERKENRATLTITKQKDGEDLGKFHYQSTKVALGFTDEDGEDVYALALSPCEEAEEIPGSRIPREEADRITIASLMKPGQVLTTAEVARLIAPALQIKMRMAQDRIPVALPQNEWVRTMSPYGVVELIREKCNATQHRIEMRLAKPAQ